MYAHFYALEWWAYRGLLAIGDTIERSPLCMYFPAYSVYLQLIPVFMCVLSTADLTTGI